MGCPGVKLAHGSSCLSHGPSSKISKSNSINIVTNDSVCKKVRSRYFYSFKRSTTAVESLLDMLREKVIKVVNGEVNGSASPKTSICGIKDQITKDIVVARGLSLKGHMLR